MVKNINCHTLLCYYLFSSCFGDLSVCSDGYTLAMWLRAGVKSASPTQYYFSSGGQTILSYGVAWYRYRGNLLECMLRLETKKWVVSASMEISMWYHFVTTWHHDEGARMYRDGVLIDIDNAPENYPYLPNGYDNVVLGVPNNVQDAFGEVWIDDIVSYEHIVDDEHVKDLYLSYFY